MCADKQPTRTKVDLLIHALHGLTLQVNKMTARLDDLVDARKEPDPSGFGESTASGDQAVAIATGASNPRSVR